MNASRRRRYDPNERIAETSIWDVYNNVADIRDDELIKDWNDSLNFLLVFAAIFAAVLTALIVESMRLLQEDPQDITNAILLQISYQLANNTLPVYQKTEFEVPAYAVIVNALLFASICCSLVAALAAVLALQWVNEYDAGIDTVDAKKRALIRHFRFIGVENWKMGGIIAMLPLLLHASVFLFFIGIALWAYYLHPIMYYICIGGATVAVAFYTITVILAASFSASPFRSPMARGLRYMIFKATSQFMRLLYKLGISFWAHSFLHERWYTPPRWLHGRLYQIWSSLEARRDARALEEKETQDTILEETTVTWTARHVELAKQSTNRLVHVLKDATPLFVEKPLEGPWVEIMDYISDTCLEKADSQELSIDDHGRIRVVLLAAMTDFFRRKSTFDRAINHGTWDRWEPTLKLTGPFLLYDDLTKVEIETVVSIIQARCSKQYRTSARELVNATRCIDNVTTRQERWTASYAVYNICIYLWISDHHRSHRQLIQRLVETVDIPRGMLHEPPPHEVSIPIALSALYSVAFGKPERERHFWASAHPLYPAGRTDERSRSVQGLHSAITSRMAVIASLETSSRLVQIHLKHLCRLLAYTPCISENNKEVDRCIEILEKLPHRFVNHHHFTHESSFTALPSVIWLSRVTRIPRIHEYLEVLLSCQRRFPTLKPVWRSWHDIHGAGDTNRLLSVFGHDKKWLDHFIHDRRLVEVLHAFDQLVDAGCSESQHVVMVQLAIHDLSDNRGGRYDEYYTKERRGRIERLRDPALRLIGTRAASMAFSGEVPHEGSTEWNSEPWIEAVRFWCEGYQMTDEFGDQALIHAALLQPNEVLHSAIMDASYENRLLRDRIRILLASALGDYSHSDDTLLLHVAAQTASWFPEYLTDARVEKLVGVLSTARPMNMRVLPVLATVITLIHTPSPLITVLTGAQRILTENDRYPGQNEICELIDVIEHTIRMPPDWLQCLKAVDQDLWRRAWDSLNQVAYILQAQEIAARAIVRWNGDPGQDDTQQPATRVVEAEVDLNPEVDVPQESNLFPRVGLGARILGFLRRPEKKVNHEGGSAYTGDPGERDLVLWGPRRSMAVDDDLDDTEEVEWSGDTRHSCSAAWAI